MEPKCVGHLFFRTLGLRVLGAPCPALSEGLAGGLLSWPQSQLLGQDGIQGPIAHILPGELWEMLVISSKVIYRQNSILQSSQWPRSGPWSHAMWWLKTPDSVFRLALGWCGPWKGQVRQDKEPGDTRVWAHGLAAGHLNLTSGQTPAAL